MSAFVVRRAPPVRPFQLWIGRPCQSDPSKTAIVVPLFRKSPSHVPEVPASSRPELPAELKKSAPPAVTVFTACAITPSWKAPSAKYVTSSTMMSHP